MSRFASEDRLILLLPSVVAVALCVPCLSLGYFWDDYYFLTFRGTGGGSQILLSVGSTGVRGIQSTLLEGHALQVWYQDPTLLTVPTVRRRVSTAPEYLVRVTPDLDLLWIDPDRQSVRSAGQAPPDASEVVRPIVSYARAVAATGDIDRAVRILERLSITDRREGASSYYRILAASFLLAAYRHEEARERLSSVPAYPLDVARRLARRLLADPTESEKLDLAAFEAFGFSSDDPETLRWVMREFLREESLGQAAWWAARLERLVPNDPEANNVARNAARAGVVPSRLPT